VAGVNRDEQVPQKFHVDWQAVHAGLNPWKRSEKVIIDPFLVAKAVKGVMRQCTQQTATGKPLVWTDYAVFMDLNDWEQVKKLEESGADEALFRARMSAAAERMALTIGS